MRGREPRLRAQDALVGCLYFLLVFSALAALFVLALAMQSGFHHRESVQRACALASRLRAAFLIDCTKPRAHLFENRHKNCVNFASCF